MNANSRTIYTCPECSKGFALRRIPRTSEPVCSARCRGIRFRRLQRQEIATAFETLRKALKIEEKSLER